MALDIKPTPAPSYKQIFRQFLPYLLTFALFWLAGGWALWRFGYEESFLILNRLHFPLGDLIMPHYTQLGDGVLITTIFSLFVIRKDKPLVISMVLSMLLVMILVAFFKTQFFSDWNRPPVVFGLESGLHYITLEGERFHSFPSGHSTAVACMFGFVAYFLSARSPLPAILLALIAVSISYSRLYIGVHFLGDMQAGTILGCLIGLFGLMILYPVITENLSKLSDRVHRMVQVLLYSLAVIFLLLDLYRLIFGLYLG
jgi:undecaprenyl-diphosphatase